MGCSKLLHNTIRLRSSRNAGRWVVLACHTVRGTPANGLTPEQVRDRALYYASLAPASDLPATN